MNRAIKTKVTIYVYFGYSLKELGVLKRKADIKNVSSDNKVLLIYRDFRALDGIVGDFDEIVRLDVIAKSVHFRDILDGVNSVYWDMDRLCREMNDDSIPGMGNVLFVERYAECEIHNKTIRIVKLIEACKRITNSYEMAQVFLLSSWSKTLEERVFTRFIRYRSIEVEIIKTNSLLGHVKRLFLVKSTLINSENFTASVLKMLVRISAEVYRIYLAKLTYTLSRHKPTISPKPNTIMLVHYHRTDILTDSHFPVMAELTKLGYYPISAVFGHRQSFRELSKSPYDGIYLDAKVTVRSLIANLVTTLKIFSRWGAKRKAILRDRPEFLIYDGISLFEFIKRNLDNLFDGIFFRRMNFMRAFGSALQTVNPVAVKPGAEQSELNILIHNMLRDTNVLTFQFHYGHTHGVTFIEHYQSQLFALPGENARKLYLAAGIDEDRLVVTGMPRYDNLKQFKSEHSQDLSKQILGIESNRNKIITTYFYDNTNPWRLQADAEDEIRAFTRMCIDFGSLLLIKPHPNCNIRVLRERFNRVFSNIDFRLVIRSELNWHLINASDLVVVDGLSTTIIEVMMLSQPRIIVLSDMPATEFKERLHGGALQVRDYEKLCSAVDKLMSDQELLAELEDNQRLAVEIERGKIDGGSAERVAQAVREKLCTMN